MPNEAAAGVSAGKATIHAGLDVLVEYIVPLVFGIAGFAGAGLLGGSNSVWGLLPSAQQTALNANLIKLGFAALWGTVGYCFWAIRSKGGIIMKFVGGALGGFFLGAGAGYLAAAAFSYSPPPNGSGLLDKLIGSVQGWGK